MQEVALWRTRTARVIWVLSWLVGVVLIYQVIPYWKGEIGNPLADALSALYPANIEAVDAGGGPVTHALDIIASAANFLSGLMFWVMVGPMVTLAGYELGKMLTLGWSEYWRRSREQDEAFAELVRVERFRRKRRELRNKAKCNSESTMTYFVVGIMFGVALF